MSDIDDLIAQIIAGPKLTPAEMLRKEVCRQTGLSEEEVEIEIDEDGVYRATCRPVRKIESLTMNIVIE